MSHKIVEVITTRPNGVGWFSDAYPNEYVLYMQWLKTVPGVVFLSRDDPNPNTIIRTYVFEDDAAYQNYINAHLQNEYSQMRARYNSENGITITANVLNE
jgi:hypothetical protein